jgi:Tol biopolymer transport system component
MPDVGKKKIKMHTPARKGPVWLLPALALLVLLLACIGVAGLAWNILGRPGLPSNLGASAKLNPNPNPNAPTGAGVSVAPNGAVAYSVFAGDSPEGKSVWLMNADGSGAKQILKQASSPAFSPDGSMLAYYHWTDGIYVANADGSNPHKILGESNAKYISWSHDGKWIAFSSQPTGREGVNVNIDAVAPDGSGRHTIVVGGSMPSWSPDDTQITFASCRGADCGIFRASALGGDGGTLVIAELGNDPTWAPTGTKILFQEDVDGIKQIFVVNSDGTGKQQLTSGTAAHVGAQWSADGNAIYYRSTQGGTWGIWKMNADGGAQASLVNGVQPVDWAYERLAIAH